MDEGTCLQTGWPEFDSGGNQELITIKVSGLHSSPWYVYVYITHRERHTCTHAHALHMHIRTHIPEK